MFNLFKSFVHAFQEQYKFSHDVIIECLRGFDTFSNLYI